MSKKGKGTGKKQNPSKYEGYKNSYMAQKTIIERGQGIMQEYYDTLIRPTLNLAKANRKYLEWQSLLFRYDVDEETEERGLGYLHHCFQSISQYKQDSEYIESLKSINALVSDLHYPYQNEEKQIPTQGANLPLAIIDNDRKIIFTIPPLLELLRNWQIGVTFINISEEYSTWPAYWSLLAHEVCGHEIINGYYNILSGDNFLITEIMNKISMKFTVRRSSLNLKIRKNNRVNLRQVSIASKSFISDYFTDQTILKETLASVMGYLNIGPAYGITLYSILRPLMEFRWNLRSLLSIPENDEPYRLKLPYGVHPIGILHMVIGKECMKCIKELSGKSGAIFDHWIEFFGDLSQVEKGDNLFILTRSRQSKFIIPRDPMFKAVEEVVRIIFNSPLDSLSALDSETGRPISDFGWWNSDDEKVTRRLVAKLQKAPLKASSLSNMVDDSNIKARHIVAATTIASASVMGNDPKKIDQINRDALEMLLQKHRKQPELIQARKRTSVIPTLRMARVQKRIRLPSIKAQGFSSLRSF